MSIFGSIFHGIVGAVKGFVTGGPLGAISGGIKGVMSKPMPTPIFKDSTASFLRSSPIMPGGGTATDQGVMGVGGGIAGAVRPRTRFKPRAAPKRRKFVTIGGRKMTRKQAKYFGGGRRRK